MAVPQNLDSHYTTKSSSLRGVKHWNRPPREVVTEASLTVQGVFAQCSQVHSVTSEHGLVQGQEFNSMIPVDPFHISISCDSVKIYIGS